MKTIEEKIETHRPLLCPRCWWGALKATWKDFRCNLLGHRWVLIEIPRLDHKSWMCDRCGEAVPYSYLIDDETGEPVVEVKTSS